MPVKQPYYAFVDLYVGEYLLTPVPPNHLIDFTHTKSSRDDMSNYFSITLFDETAIDLEYILTTHIDEEFFKTVHYRYGYVEGIKSFIYEGFITDYSLNFNSVGAVLTIEGLSKAMTSHGKPKTRTFEDKDIHEIIYNIATEEGWFIGRVEETRPIYVVEDDGFGNEVRKKETLYTKQYAFK